MIGKGNAFFAVFGITYAVVAASAPLPMPATTPEEIIALAHRTYDYVARSVPEKELAALKDELAVDEKWYADAKKANDAREMRNAVRELKSVRRRILFRHPDLQFKRLLAVQRGLPFSQEGQTPLGHGPQPRSPLGRRPRPLRVLRPHAQARGRSEGLRRAGRGETRGPASRLVAARRSREPELRLARRPVLRDASPLLHL